MSADDHTDELDKPLGQDPKRKKPFVLPVPVVVRSIAGILGLCVAVLIGWILFVDEPFGGEPVALVSAATAQGNKSAEQSAPQTKPNSAPVALADSGKPSGRTVTIIDGSTGKRQDVTVGCIILKGRGGVEGFDIGILSVDPLDFDRCACLVDPGPRGGEPECHQAASGDNHPIHYDVEYCRRRGMPDMLAHGFQVLIQTAAGAGDFPYLVEDSLIGFLEQSSRFLKPVYSGDTLYPALEIVDLKPNRSTGVVAIKSTVHNQKSELVMDGTQRYLLRKKP